MQLFQEQDLMHPDEPKAYGGMYQITSIFLQVSISGTVWNVWWRAFWHTGTDALT